MDCCLELPSSVNEISALCCPLKGICLVSIARINRIYKPIVWTPLDVWAFCGAEHYATDWRWRDGYLRDNRLAHEIGFDLNRFTWQRKRKYWRRPMQIVCPSEWLADCVRSSALMHDWPVEVVPNPIDTDRWLPIEQYQARQFLALPQECPLLLFGALGGGRDHHKGFDLLRAALAHLRTEPSLQTLQLVVFGQLPPQSPPKLGFPVHFIGHLNDDLSLRALHSASDAMVISSRQDSLPNTELKAHACGTPVVAFITGGLPDIVAHQSTGYLARPFEPRDLAACISWVLADPQRRRVPADAARTWAEQLWNPERVSRLYQQVYQQAMECSK